MPADSTAVRVRAFVFRLARLNTGALYTEPGYSARNEIRLVESRSRRRRQPACYLSCRQLRMEVAHFIAVVSENETQ
jgi:hypothetical protein